ncbi:hypothetical protein BDQ12DRAFT_674870 [Crucibulum laeve]|uniref:C3H1-type domain-containing protein n=1 Tax=Crucibulum laeve TaxID=68775 RepID=A0A5C3MHF8_9AGAR|nr:hypothetical protein BDQ12DRAFT_674870 [Crucibulum laeve]
MVHIVDSVIISSSKQKNRYKFAKTLGKHFAQLSIQQRSAVYGEECCYEHYCPLLTTCYFFKEGRCKFLRGDMHKEL